MKYHLYKRTVKKNNTSITAWYYWFYDENRKQVRKSCGKDGKMCLRKRDAEIFIEELILLDKQKEETKKIRLSDISNQIYMPDSNYMKLKKARGYNFEEKTLEQKNTVIQKYINVKFGGRDPESIDSAEIEDWLINLDVSNTYKNKIIYELDTIFKECLRLKIIKNKPYVEPFKPDSRRKDIFTINQIKLLFPENNGSFQKIFIPPLDVSRDNYTGIDGKVHSYGLMFAIMFFTTLTAGLRSCEIKGLCWEQIYDEYIFLDRMINKSNKLVFHLKKGTIDNPKHRIVVIPDKTIELLELWKKVCPADNKSDFLFTFNGDIISQRMLETRFNYGLINTNICGKIKVPTKNGFFYRVDKQDKLLSVHSLRYTYNTFMVNKQFPGEVLRTMIGHESVKMTNHYTKFDLESKLSGLIEYKDNINEIWNGI